MVLTVCWFRQDLRINDNPALSWAASKGDVLPVYILDDDNAGDHKMGAASRVWLHHSLESLNQSLDNNLRLFHGNARSIIEALAKETDADHVVWNRCYEPWRMKRDEMIKQQLNSDNIDVKSFNGSLLWEPWTNLKDNGEPYWVFTPFYKKAFKSEQPREPHKAPENINVATVNCKDSLSLDELKLLPSIRWDQPMMQEWDASETGAKNKLYHFLDNGLANYKEGRNEPCKENVSYLSPYLHYGQLSPHQVWHAARFKGSDKNSEHFCSELGWREFSNNLFYHFKELPWKNLQEKFNNFPWKDNERYLKAWQHGKTGYPLVDAGMRQLWQTGYIHNRVRMVVGSFLVKNLLIHWHHGEQWFWDCLVDADLANNSASWQWISGCGADAAPYFRVFNPVMQGEKFDPDGEYTKRYVPELKNLPAKYLYAPWDAPSDALEEASITLGIDYPHPIVDLKESRNVALAAYQKIKASHKP